MGWVREEMEIEQGKLTEDWKLGGGQDRHGRTGGRNRQSRGRRAENLDSNISESMKGLYKIAKHAFSVDSRNGEQLFIMNLTCWKCGPVSYNIIFIINSSLLYQAVVK